MTPRPAARPSSLAGRSPVKPVESPESRVEPNVATETPEAPEAAPQATAKPVGGSPKDDEAKKVGFYMKPTDQIRAKRAHTTTIIHTGLSSWTAYVNEAVMAYTKQLEAKYNDSKPF